MKNKRQQSRNAAALAKKTPRPEGEPMVSPNHQMASNDGKPALPKGWVWTRLGTFSEINPKFSNESVSVDQDASFVPMKCVEEMTGHIDLSHTRKLSEVMRGYTFFANGDLILAKITPCMENGKFAIAENLKNGVGFGSTEFHVIRLPKQFPRKFFFYFLLQTEIRRNARRQMTGSAGQLRVPVNYFHELSCAFPPLPEQHRIVAKIEELFTKLDAGVAELKKAKAQLQRYRQSVLKDAFSGKLTQAWREARKDELEPAAVLLERIKAERKKNSKAKYKEPPPVDASNLPELPEEWVWETLEALSWDSGYGTSVKCDYEYDGFPVLRIPNVVGGRIDLNDLKFASASVNLLETESLSSKDLLVVRTNGSRDLIGRAAIVNRNLDGPHFFASYLIRFRLLEQGCIPVWVGKVFQSARVRGWIEKEAATTAGQYNISMTKLNKLPIEIPPLAEQHQIVSEIERRFSIAEEVEKVIDQSLKQAERLRQSILQRAFAGKLVAQDPNDEPAEKLLERIQAEKAKREVDGKVKSR